MTSYVMTKHSTYTHLYTTFWIFSTPAIYPQSSVHQPLTMSTPESDSSSEESDPMSDVSLETYKRVSLSLLNYSHISNVSFQMLRKKEARINQLVIQLASKEKQIAAVNNIRPSTNMQSSTGGASWTRKAKHIYILDPALRTAIQALSREMTYMNFFWIHPSDEKIFNIEKDLLYSPQSRYKSEEMQQQGLLHDLLAGMPEKCYGAMGTETFTK